LFQDTGSAGPSIHSTKQPISTQKGNLRILTAFFAAYVRDMIYSIYNIYCIHFFELITVAWAIRPPSIHII